MELFYRDDFNEFSTGSDLAITSAGDWERVGDFYIHGKGTSQEVQVAAVEVDQHTAGAWFTSRLKAIQSLRDDLHNRHAKMQNHADLLQGRLQQVHQDWQAALEAEHPELLTARIKVQEAARRAAEAHDDLVDQLLRAGFHGELRASPQPPPEVPAPAIPRCACPGPVDGGNNYGLATCNKCGNPL
jgi:hypothetical protein